MQILVSFMVGLMLPLLMGATTDQIWNTVFDSANSALRVNQVAGGGAASSMTVGSTTISGGSTGQLLYDNAGVLGERANPLIVAAGGTGAATFTAHGVLLGNTTSAVQVTSAGTAGQVLTSNGASSDPTFQGVGASTASPVSIQLANASSTGTTANKLAKINTDGTAVIVATTDTVGALGPVTAGAGTTGSATILLIGSGSCVFDGATTAGDYVGISSGTAGDCTDLGSTFPSNKAVLGIIPTTNGGAGTYTVLFDTPDIMNTTNIKGGNPGKGNITNLAYTGTLNASDIHSNTTGTTVAHRFEVCGSGASGSVSMTLPASPAVGDIYTLIQQNASNTCVFARAGSQTIDGGTTATLTAGVAIGKDCTVIYVSSNNWHASGACT